MIRQLFCGTIILFLSVTTYAQTAIFTWEEGLKKHIGTYDTKTNTQENLRLIYEHLVNVPASFFEAGNVWTIHQMDSTFLQPLDSVYEVNKAELNKIVLPESDFWKDLKQKRMTELEQFYLAKRLEILSYTNPQVLLNSNYSFCLLYAEALNGTEDQLLETWKTLHEKQKKNNSSPEVIEAQYLSELNSENSLLYARLNVTVYGWWNCINDTLPYVHDPNGRIMDEFKKLFIKTEAHFFED